jgi:hypothetical protein
MLHRLPVEISFAVLSYLPLSTLGPLSSISRTWRDFFSANKSTIFRNAAILHEYIHPETLLLEDALSMREGSPWRGAADWKDFCKLTLDFSTEHTFLIFVGRRGFQLHKNWEGNGRAGARLLYPGSGDAYCLKVDEKAGLLITTCSGSGLGVTHLFSNAFLWYLGPVRLLLYYPHLALTLAYQ